MNDNLAELRKAEAGRSLEEQRRLTYVLIGALSQLVPAETWARALNTTYSYIRSAK